MMEKKCSKPPSKYNQSYKKLEIELGPRETGDTMWGYVGHVHPQYPFGRRNMAIKS